MDHFVKLDKLPEGFDFPLDLQDRLNFDAAGKKLVYRGYMSKADFDRVCRLTTDWNFRRTLEDLFRLCVPEDELRPRRANGFLAAFARLFSLG
jgi:hypothetical protein